MASAASADRPREPNETRISTTFSWLKTLKASFEPLLISIMIDFILRDSIATKTKRFHLLSKYINVVLLPCMDSGLWTRGLPGKETWSNVSGRIPARIGGNLVFLFFQFHFSFPILPSSFFLLPSSFHHTFFILNRGFRRI